MPSRMLLLLSVRRTLLRGTRSLRIIQLLHRTIDTTSNLSISRLQIGMLLATDQALKSSLQLGVLACIAPATGSSQHPVLPHSARNLDFDAEWCAHVKLCCNLLAARDWRPDRRTLSDLPGSSDQPLQPATRCCPVFSFCLLDSVLIDCGEPGRDRRQKPGETGVEARKPQMRGEKRMSTSKTCRSLPVNFCLLC